MKRIVCLLMCLCICISFFACASEEPGSKTEEPPAFGIIKKGITLNKKSPESEGVTFSKAEFESALGCEISYITVSALPESGSLRFRGLEVMTGQTLPADSLEYLRFVPDVGSEKASFGFSCDAQGWSGAEITCNIRISDSENVSPVCEDMIWSTYRGIAVTGRLSASDPDGDGIKINVISYPTDGYVEFLEDGWIVYTPAEGFTGSDRMVYSVTDEFGAVSGRATLMIDVELNEDGLIFSDMQDDYSQLSAVRMCKDGIMLYRLENGEYIFSPDSEVAKYEFLVMLMCVAGADKSVSAVSDSVAIDDSGLSSGIKGYIDEAVDNGFVELDSGNFYPRASVTLADALDMAGRVLSLPTGSNVDTVIDTSLLNVTQADGFITKRDAAIILCGVKDYMEKNGMRAGN